MTIDTELSDFNWHFLSQYGRVKFYAAGRFWDAKTFDNAPIDPYRLACEFYARHGFNVEPQDFYRMGNRIKYKSIDALVAENPEKLSDVGQMLYGAWLGYKKKLDADRAKEPQASKIDPPPPEPPPVVVEKPKLPEVRVPNPPVATKPPWKLIATILAAIAFGLKFTPVPAIVIGIVDTIVKILQAIPQ